MSNLPDCVRPALVLVQPRIPQNVGAVGRLCAASACTLHVVRPIPFQLNDSSLRRAGMDYLELLDLQVHTTWADCRAALSGRRLWYLSSKATRPIHGAGLRLDDVLVFGSETSGLPADVIQDLVGSGLLLPMPQPRARCLNLATAAAISLYELLRQGGQFNQMD